MAKKVYTDGKFFLGGVDVSDSVHAWSVGATIGELHMAEITLQDNPKLIRITERDERSKFGVRVSTNAKIEVSAGDGVWADISNWVSGWDKIVRVGRVDLIRLRIQADRDVLSINGTTPWEMQGAAS